MYCQAGNPVSEYLYDRGTFGKTRPHKKQS